MSYYYDIQNFNKGLSQIEKDLKVEISKFNTEFSQYPANDTALTPSQKVQKRSISSQKKYSEDQLVMISSYKTNYESVLPVVEKVQEDVDFFILTIEEASKVYKKAYETAELSLNISNAIDSLSQFDELVSLSDDIMTSWDNLDSIMDNLTELTQNL